jgi:hypothetical protein
MSSLLALGGAILGRGSRGMSIVHIHAPQATEKYHKFANCPDCGKTSLFLSFYTEWYGVDSTCMRCGRRWCDGEWMPLLFYRHARRDNKKSARRQWRQMNIPITQVVDL